MAHALLSPSAAHRWLRCTASAALEATMPESSSVYADRGTAMHNAAALRLSGSPWSLITGLEPDEVAIVDAYVDQVEDIAGQWSILIEQCVDFSETIGVANSFGTADCVIMAGDELILCDLKTGRGVQVDAENNEQLMLYALGALETFGIAGDFRRVRMFIIQPPLGHTSEWTCSVEDLRYFAKVARSTAAAITSGQTVYRPGEKQCRFCKAKSTCSALAQHVGETVLATFDDLDAAVQAVPAIDDGALVGEKLAQVELIEGWCKAIRERAYDLLAAGQDVDGYKLVEGRRGARQWKDEAEAEKTLKTMKLKEAEMYDFSLISPTTAEKRAKAGVIGPKQWPRLQSLITQADGRPSVAPASDKRPAISPIAKATDFDNLGELT